MADVLKRVFAAIALAVGVAGAGAQPASVPNAAPIAVPTAADPALEAHMLAITGELRCLVCQNQTIADSQADLAVDLRRQVREQLRQGRTDTQIRDYMTARYGDFVLYRPELKAKTIVLWLGPALLLAVAAFALVVTIRRRARLADDRFEPDPPWDDDDASSTPRPGAPA